MIIEKDGKKYKVVEVIEPVKTLVVDGWEYTAEDEQKGNRCNREGGDFMNDDNIILRYTKDGKSASTFNTYQLRTLKGLMKKARADEREKMIIKLFQLDWIKAFRDAYESRKTSWNDIGHIREWRNATDEVMTAIIKQLREALAKEEGIL